MRKLYLIVALLLLATTTILAQDPNNHWQLGTSDVNFTTNPPTVATVANSGQYGNASVSDDFGNLLFYTDGHTVWNKNHSVMTNGNLQQFGTINNVVIVPNPMNSNQYYIFKSEIYACLCLKPNTNYYAFHIVEFSATNPYGNVLSIIPTKLQANNAFLENTERYGPLTVAKNDLGNAYWLITQSGNRIYSFKIDSNGLNTVPVESVFLANQIYNFDTTANSTKIISSKFKMTNSNLTLIGLENSGTNPIDSDPVSSPDRFYKLTFNPQTGTFSNYIFLTYAKTVLGFELSQNSNNLFYTQYNNPVQVWLPDRNKGEIRVMDISMLSIRTLSLSGTSQMTTNFGNLQKDKYGTILVTATTSDLNKNKYLHKIDNQDSYTNVSLSLNFVSLNGNTISALPQLIPQLSLPCINDVLVTSNVITSTDKKQASNTIRASNIINSGASAIYHAGSSVTLTNGFNAKAGSVFKAYIAGCTNTFAKNSSSDKTAMVSENAIIGLVKLYPNPNTGIFTIDLGFENKNEIAISIYDVQSKAVYNSSTKEATISINLPNLPLGLYIIKLQGDNYNETVKFIKE